MPESAVTRGPGRAWAAKAAVTLAQLAQHVLFSQTDTPPGTVRAILQVCCPHIADAAERARLWDEYLAAVKQEGDILDGLIGWADVDPELTCQDRTQAATDIAVEMSRQALEALTGARS